MNRIDKVIRIGNGPNGSIFAKIKFTDGKLSISGVEGPKRNGDCKGGCGQIVMHEWRIAEFAPGWNADKVEQFRAIWKQWHLNDMQAGSPAQTAYLEANPVTESNYFAEASAALTAAGLNPDPNYLHPKGVPYKYGSAWLRVEVPESALDFLVSLPETDITPAWV